MAAHDRHEMAHSPLNINNLAKRTTCDLCRERKVRCDRSKPECLRCKRSGYQCTYSSAKNHGLAITAALQELNDRLRQAETIIQKTSKVKESHGADEANTSRFLLPVEQTNPANCLPDDDDVAVSDQDLTYTWHQMAADGFDTVFHQVEDDMQKPDNKKNEVSTNNDEMISDTTQDCWYGNFSLPEGQLDLSHCRPQTRAADGITQTPEDILRDSVQAYFRVTQKHLPLVDEERFMQYTFCSHTSQDQALRYAVCMAGAHVKRDAALEEQCYKAARHYLEQAEMGVGDSTFWALEAAQALMLVARYEFTHMRSPRALITVARLDRLIAILHHDRADNGPLTLDPNQSTALDHIRQLEITRTRSLALSLRFMEPSMFLPQGKARWQPMSSRSSNETFVMDSERDQGPIPDDISTTRLNKLDNCSIFVLSLGVSADSDRHDRDTAADAAASTVKYNFCSAHDRIDRQIGILVSWLASSAQPPNGPQGDELPILALIIVLGARIKLFNTAIRHSSMASFLNPVVSECVNQNVLTAKDISDLLLQAHLLDPLKMEVYREAGFYIMPSLALAVEAHLRQAQVSAKKTGRVGDDKSCLHLSRETRDSLKLLWTVMEACKDETDRHEDLLAECKAVLNAAESSQRLRTEFPNLGRHSTVN